MSEGKVVRNTATIPGILVLKHLEADFWGKLLDYIYHLFQDRIGIPPCLVNKNIDIIREDRPDLYHKLIKSYENK